MATYHCSVKVGGAGKGAAHDEYLRRDGRYKDGDRYEDLEYASYGNMPKWAEHNPAHFWQAADNNERKNGSVYREFEIALPRELTTDQRRELVQDIIKQEIGDKHAYTVAIHCPKASLEGGEQPHAHIMYSERKIDGIERDPEQHFKRANKSKPESGGCVKSDRFSGGKTADQRQEAIKTLRANIAEVTNKHLERYGHKTRVDHRSLKDQGIDRAPERHLGGSGVRQHGTYIRKIREEIAQQHSPKPDDLTYKKESTPEKTEKEPYKLDRAEIDIGIRKALARYEVWKQAEAQKKANEELEARRKIAEENKRKEEEKQRKEKEEAEYKEYKQRIEERLEKAEPWLKDFRAYANDREYGYRGYRDHDDLWKAFDDDFKEKIEKYNSSFIKKLFLEKLTASDEAITDLKAMMSRAGEVESDLRHSQGHGMSG